MYCVFFVFFSSRMGQTKQKKRKTHGHTHTHQETTSLIICMATKLKEARKFKSVKVVNVGPEL